MSVQELKLSISHHRYNPKFRKSNVRLMILKRNYNTQLKLSKLMTENNPFQILAIMCEFIFFQRALCRSNKVVK